MGRIEWHPELEADLPKVPEEGTESSDVCPRHLNPGIFQCGFFLAPNIIKRDVVYLEIQVYYLSLYPLIYLDQGTVSWLCSITMTLSF